VCGVVGWADFSRDLRREGATVRAMTAAMALRGPDGEGVWLQRHAGFGHRRLAVIDLETGDQPMTVEHDGRVLAGITYSGEVYNYRELRGELQSKGHTFRTESDTEVVLRSYLEWGEDFVDRLNGMYAFGLWDVREERLLLVRDRMGIKPLYFFTGIAGSVLFASEPKGIFAHPLTEAVIDTDGLREMLSFTKTPGQAVYKDLHEVRPGEILTVDAQGIKHRKYWSPSYQEHRDDLKTTISTVRELMDDIVARQMIADVPLCTLLSGGLDSSALSGLAAKALREQGQAALRTFAVDFTGQTENFAPDAMRATPDGPYVHEVAKHAATDHADIVLDAAALIDPLHRGAVAAAYDLPNFLGDMFTSLYLLFAAVREQSTVALSGEAADEVFGGYAWFHMPKVIAEPTFPWMALMNDDGSGGGVLNDELARRLDVRSYRADRYAEALKEIEHGDDPDPHNRRMREVSYLHLTRFVQILLDRKDRMSMAHGLEVRVPFCDHRLVQYVYNTPWAMKTYDGREKSLLRGATRDVLPESVAQRVKSPYPSTQDPRYDLAVREQFGRVLKDSPAADLLDLAGLRALASAPPEADQGGLVRRTLEMVLGLDLFFRRTRVRLSL
jgi:asparagine synthase (glutamine-hydrolysing)